MAFTKFSWIYWLIVWFLLLLDLGYAVRSKTVKELPFPEGNSAVRMIERNIYAVYKYENRIFGFPRLKDFFVLSGFEGIKETSEETFGLMLSAKRGAFEKLIGIGDWRAAHIENNKMIMLDGLTPRIVSIDAKDYKFISQHTIAWDIIKPPLDKQGEPTTPETVKFRQRFKREYKKLDQNEELKLSGMSKLPKKWTEGNKQSFLVLSRVSGFPLLTMSCHRETPSQCVIERGCFVEKLGHINNFSSMQSLAISAKRNYVYVGDSERHKILRFKYYSCFNIVYDGEILLPAKLKRLTSLFIDPEDRLWISTNEYDDYLNANVYTWPAEQW